MYNILYMFVLSFLTNKWYVIVRTERNRTEHRLILGTYKKWYYTLSIFFFLL